MFSDKIVFAQLMEFLPRRTFDSCVRRYQGHKRIRHFSCRDQFLCMAFAQLTFRESLRDIETCLRAMSSKLYHAGFRSRVARSTLADANLRRDWRIWRDLAESLIAHARRLYGNDDLGMMFDKTVYALDASVIELCLSLFPWAHSQRRSAAIKLHALVDLRGNIPCFLRVSGTKTRDCAMLDHLPVEAGSFYVMDRDYNDFGRLHRLHAAGSFFVVRGKKNLAYCVRQSHPIDPSTGVGRDQTIALTDRRTRRKYAAPLRRITYHDAETERSFIFLTNDFLHPPLTIAELYRRRWQIELFFKWIKQHLRIKHFVGNTINAVETQIWIAISTYVLVAIVKKELAVSRSLSEILQILSMTLFEKTPIKTVFSHNAAPVPKPTRHNQLVLFDF